MTDLEKAKINASVYQICINGVKKDLALHPQNAHKLELEANLQEYQKCKEKWLNQLRDLEDEIELRGNRYRYYSRITERRYCLWHQK